MLNRFAKFSFSIAEIDRCWHKLAAEEMEKYEIVKESESAKQ